MPKTSYSLFPSSTPPLPLPPPLHPVLLPLHSILGLNSLIIIDAMSAPFQKIIVQNPVVELDGDEMTRIIWKKIREEVCVLTASAIYRFLRFV